MMMPLRILAALAVVAIGCGAGEAAPSATGSGGTGVMPCMTDPQCGDGSACMGGICVARSKALNSMAVEIRPPTASALTAGVTELVSVDLSSLQTLAMEAVESIKLIFNGASNAPVPAPAGVVYTLPSRIPRRPPLTFETVLRVANDPALLPLPVNLSAVAATIRLLPRSGPDQDIPPYLFTAPAGNTKTFTIPSELFAISGTLRDAIGAPPGAYDARAYQNGALISNRPQLDADGNFLLFMPSTAAAGDVSIELVPTGDESRPWFKFAPLPAPRPRLVGLGTVYLATYTVPDGDVLIKAVDEETHQPIAGAFVRATTTMETTAAGETRFQLDSVTNTQGIVTLRLLPGTAQRPRMYDLRVFPDAGSRYASACQTISVTGPGPREVPLRPRPIRTGTLFSARRTPIAGAMVVATRPPPAPTECVSPVQLSTTTFTGANGRFSLSLDPGTYQIDFIPQAGAPVPRLTKYDVEVREGISDVDVQLPEGALVHGAVLNSFNEPVANALIRIFDTRCVADEPCTLPALIAETQTDAKGEFRVVAAVRVVSAVP
jgi:hypothetical protein